MYPNAFAQTHLRTLLAHMGQSKAASQEYNSRVQVQPPGHNSWAQV